MFFITVIFEIICIHIKKISSILQKQISGIFSSIPHFQHNISNFSKLLCLDSRSADQLCRRLSGSTGGKSGKQLPDKRNIKFLKIRKVVCPNFVHPVETSDVYKILIFARKSDFSIIVNGLTVLNLFQLSNDDFILFVACMQHLQTLC